MKFYPVLLRVSGRRCVVIGGGTMAEPKALALLKAGAAVTIVSPAVTTKLAGLVSSGVVEHHQRPYRRGDLSGAALAFAAANNEEVHRQVFQEAEAAGIPLNVVDRPALCSFIVPAIVERGDLLIAISTSGASPAMARTLRRDLEARFGEEYQQTLEILGKLRSHSCVTSLSSDHRFQAFGSLAESRLVEYVRDRRVDEINELLTSTFGAQVSLAQLGVEFT